MKTAVPNITKQLLKSIFFMYNQCQYQNLPSVVCTQYLQKWKEYENIAIELENKEINTKVNKIWRNCKKDGKKLWQLVDWHGKAEKKDTVDVQKSVKYKFFSEIFQSKKTAGMPIVADVIKDIELHNIYIPYPDDPPSLDELEEAISNSGKGVSFDGLPANILLLIPDELKQIIHKLMINVFFGDYPSNWEKQILHAIPKEGHTTKDPKLRGIAIPPLLCKLYDSIITQRFAKWYVPNKEQSGFRKGQGCLLPLFSIMMLFAYAHVKNEQFYVGFMDYEKAFDYANRALIIKDLIKKGCGKNITSAIAKMYMNSEYIPVAKNRLGDGISTSFGVTQGRKSSTNLYSFHVSDMPDVLSDQHQDFMDPFNIGQLADDTAVYAASLISLESKLKKVMKYSKRKGQVANMKKTRYIHFSDNPSTTPIIISEREHIFSVKVGKTHRYLGINFTPCRDMKEILTRKLNDRMHNVHKYYGWLEVNKNTPIEAKLLVLDSGVFSPLTYGAETWGDISVIKKKLLSIEIKALKVILNIKTGTSNDLVYFELGRGTIYSRILDRQFKFFKKFENLFPEESSCVSIYNVTRQTDFIKYYKKLHGHYYNEDIKDRRTRIATSDTSMISYYRDFNFSSKCSIYCNFMVDSNRSIITRWRFSNHSLRIETGRYQIPPLPRSERKCKICDIMEDEKHVIFNCLVYNTIRQSFRILFSDNISVSSFLEPPVTNLNMVATFLHGVEKVREKMKLL